LSSVGCSFLYRVHCYAYRTSVHLVCILGVPPEWQRTPEKSEHPCRRECGCAQSPAAAPSPLLRWPPSSTVGGPIYCCALRALAFSPPATGGAWDGTRPLPGWFVHPSMASIIVPIPPKDESRSQAGLNGKADHTFRGGGGQPSHPFPSHRPLAQGPGSTHSFL